MCIYALFSLMVSYDPFVVGFWHPIFTVKEESADGMIHVIFQSYSSLDLRFKRSIPMKLDFLSVIGVLDTFSLNAKLFESNAV